MNARVLGIDPSLTCTALVGLTYDQIEEAYVVAYRGEVGGAKKDFASGPARLNHMRNRLLAALADFNPTLVVLEDYAFGAQGQGIRSTAEWGGLLRWTLWQAGLPVLLVPPTVLKKHVCKKGNADKALMLREVFRRYAFEAKGDDEADARGLADIGRFWAETGVLVEGVTVIEPPA